MRQGEIAERLMAIEGLIRQVLPQQQIATALRDIEDSYGLAGQLVEVAHAQREQIEALIVRLDRLMTDMQAHDGRLVAHDRASQEERDELRGLMVQLRSLMRDQVRKTEDLTRAVGDGSWDGDERRRA